MRRNTKLYAVPLAGLATVLLATLAVAQHAGHGGSAPAAVAPTPPAAISSEELHRTGGVPRGWKFTLPSGDAAAGREVFSKLECNKCHEVKPDFPRGERGAGDVGPELTGMGTHHPAEYFAQSIVDPNAVIVGGPGFVGPDGRSVMPDYRDAVTFTELLNVVAYLKSLRADAQHDHAAAPAREQTAGPYRVRVEYHRAGAHGHQDGAAGAQGPKHGAPGGDDARPHQHGAGPSGSHGADRASNTASGHLMVFITDADTGEVVPYLPVSVRIGAAAAKPVRLAPMISGSGFHYGADLKLPEGTTTLTLHVGAAGLKTMGAAAGRFTKPVTMSLSWSD